jgi:cardiolipin synthase A/B
MQHIRTFNLLIFITLWMLLSGWKMNAFSDNSRAELEAISGAHATSGNRVEILDNGPHAFGVWTDMIADAKESIHLQTYYIDDSGQCSKLMELLKSKAALGVDINLIITRYTQLSMYPLAYLDLILHGIKVVTMGGIGFPVKVETEERPWYLKMQSDYRILKKAPAENPFFRWSNKQGQGQFVIDYAIHEKMLIVDGKKAIVGGRNLSDCYFFWWHDLDMLLTGPIVEELDKAFCLSWQTFNGDPLKPQKVQAPILSAQGIPALLVHSRPWEGKYVNLDVLVRSIDLSRKRVFVTSQYLGLPDQLEKSLCTAAKRGVDVRILTNSFETGKEVAMSLCHFISLNYYSNLLKAGVRIYEYSCDPKQNRKPYFHAKEVMVDGKYCAIGSYNLSLRSAYLESELMIYMFDKTLTEQREGNFLNELAGHSREVLLPDLAKEEKRFAKLMEMARRVEILY